MVAVEKATDRSGHLGMRNPRFHRDLGANTLQYLHILAGAMVEATVRARCSRIDNLCIGSANLDQDGLGVDFILGATANLKIGKVELDRVEVSKDKNA
ncbi:hypothetical protein PRIPAC_88473 [Pristionchus pacificus]|uniref:Uncharacterized protein n=1 Tax=Pristionchus pacificus TaxID=54126 RepID=A0A2A6B3Z8_PRIPA|nr:hypothetical protein PRIPAC_88473 [Pristionchus pacificus]|eukprot:PDM60583.1 hypothetical protein PRIPAC_53561 [Pristionchus pacificus]